MAAHDARRDLGGELVYYAIIPEPERNGPQVLFLRAEDAVAYGACHEAAATSATWGEFRARVPGPLYEQLMELMGGRDGEPEGGEPCRLDDLGPYLDGDWPGFVEGEMLTWVPRGVQTRYGRVEQTLLNGPMLVLDPRWADWIVAEMEGAGYRCIRDDRAVLRAVGLG